jgi:hypothetical protein
MLSTAAGAAVQEQCGDAASRADLLHVEPMTVADIKHARIKGADRRLRWNLLRHRVWPRLDFYVAFDPIKIRSLVLAP